MKKQLFSIAMLLTSATMAQKQAPVEKFAATISPKALKEKLTVIASADMEGRETATAGQRKAASYIETFFKKIGLEPGAPDGKYQMYYPVYQDSLNDIHLTVGGSTLVLGKDYTISGNALTDGNWKADDFVFASYGLVDSTKNYFDGLDVKGKWVMLLEGVPADAKMHPYAAYRSNFTKMMSARTKGAAGILMVTKELNQDLPKSRKGSMYLKKNTNGIVPVVYIDVATADKLLNASAKTVADLSTAKSGAYSAPIDLTIKKEMLNLQSSNVIGVLPGTDKKDEYVFITGHYDHLGKRDSIIWFGADDDGSGTTSVMQMAQAFVNAKKKGYKPRRSIVFMMVSGEEKGLWGSEYFSEHPTVPLDKVSVDLNVDMDGRVDTERETPDTLNYIYVIGHDKLSSDLQKINEGANNKYTKLVLDYKFDDPKDPNRIYYRSDHYNFAKKGVPILFFYDGMLKADYHQPTDTIDKINFDLMSKRAQMIFYTAWDMINRDEMLKRDIPLN